MAYTLNTIDRHAICYAVDQPKEIPPAEIYDARGNGEGGVAPTITGDHNGHISDYTAILAIEARHEEPRCYEDGCSPAVIARAGTGGGNTPIVLLGSRQPSVGQQDPDR